jgi:type VI secretion system VasD/TssJ family lipoprotein
LPLAIAVAVAVSGCSGTQRVSVNLHGVAPLNLNDQNESTPVDVRFFALKSDAAFRAATVDALWTDYKKVLGDDLLGEPQAVTVFPGAAADPRVVHELQIDGQAKFLGVLALFRRADAEDHRSLIVPVATAEDQVLVFTGFAVSLKPKMDPNAQ